MYLAGLRTAHPNSGIPVNWMLFNAAFRLNHVTHPTTAGPFKGKTGGLHKLLNYKLMSVI
jgi:hypothetical protein